MQFQHQQEKAVYLEQELQKFGDGFFPTLQHFKHLESMTDSLPIGNYSAIESRMLHLGDHIRHLVELSTYGSAHSADRL